MQKEEIETKGTCSGDEKYARDSSQRLPATIKRHGGFDGREEGGISETGQTL